MHLVLIKLLKKKKKLCDDQSSINSARATWSTPQLASHTQAHIRSSCSPINESIYTVVGCALLLECSAPHPHHTTRSSASESTLANPACLSDQLPSWCFLSSYSCPGPKPSIPDILGRYKWLVSRFTTATTPACLPTCLDGLCVGPKASVPFVLTAWWPHLCFWLVDWAARESFL